MVNAGESYRTVADILGNNRRPLDRYGGGPWALRYERALIIGLGGWWLSSGRRSRIPFSAGRMRPAWPGLSNVVYVAGILNEPGNGALVGPVALVVVIGVATLLLP